MKYFREKIIKDSEITEAFDISKGNVSPTYHFKICEVSGMPQCSDCMKFY